MTKDQEDNLNMQQTTSDVLHEFEPVWTANVPFDAAVDELDATIDKIADKRDIQEQDTTGVAEDKQNARQTLEDDTYTAASIISSYASTIQDRELLQKVNFTRTELREARDNELPGMSEQVHQEAVTNAAAVLPYGLTALMTTDLGTAKTDFVTSISKPRKAITKTSAATEQLVPLFNDQFILLTERIDKAMELFRVSNNDFYVQYFNARIIVNSPTLTRALSVKFVDDITGLPLEHVIVKVDTSINRRSSSLGNIQVQNLAEGAHALTAALAGFHPESASFNVIAGETTKLVIRMKKV